MTQQEQHEVQLRLSCLSLAVQTFHLQPERVLEAAQDFYNYAIGTNYAEIVDEITKEDLKNNPTLKSQGIKKGDTISIPQEI